MNSIDRALVATQSKNDSDLARYLGVNTSSVSGFRKRETLPLEQCIKIAEQTGVSLDWLILGKGEARAEQMPIEQQMLLTGWQQLPPEKRDYFFNLLLQLARGGEIPAAGSVNVRGNAAQAAGGNASIGTLNIGKN